MAIINNNVENVKFLRNQTPFESREAARQALENNKSQAADGTALLARYSKVESGATVIKTIVGYVAVVGETHHLTIIDVEGGSQDVENLREEINAKLGTTFISSSNTVESNLTALSGNNSSTSAETSVEGAKRYADGLKEAMDFSGVTTGTGVYVTNVTQADGIVSATTATLPTVTDTKEAKKVVVGVSEDKGTISVERGTISSNAETMVLTDNADGGVNFEVNIDNNTIIQDAETKKLKVADAALIQYVGDEDTIHISAAVEGVKTVSSLLTIKEVSTSVPDTVAHRYMLAGTGTTKIGEYIDIPKDSALVNFYLGHVDDLLEGTTAQTEESISSTVVPGTGDTALVWVMQLANGKYKLTAVDVHSFIDEAEFASGVTWDSTAKKVKGVVDPTSESFLTVGANGFKLAGVQDAIDDLAALSGKTITAITSTNGSITAQIDDAAGNKSVNIETDASKIKMSGFTSTDALKDITSSSSITEAFEEVDAVITENERVTAGALTDLDDRIDTVSGDVDTIKTNYISGASVNGTAATVSNNSIALSINSTASTGAESSPITVTTAEGGVVTLKFDGIDCGFYA